MSHYGNAYPHVPKSHHRRQSARDYTGTSMVGHIPLPTTKHGTTLKLIQPRWEAKDDRQLLLIRKWVKESFLCRLDSQPTSLLYILTDNWCVYVCTCSSSVMLTFSLLYFHKTVRCGCGSIAVGSELLGNHLVADWTYPTTCMDPIIKFKV